MSADRQPACRASVRVRESWSTSAVRECGDMQGLADRLGVDRSTVWQKLEGRRPPGAKFIAAVLTRFAVRFDDAFEVVDDPAEVA
ncbi:MAG: helix-turn-helix domain-containing protein [Micrococcales bacterium]|nr:helix-turn-helix domain-containing protein [Micrococcales bacterium]